MTYNLLKGKKGIIFGALDENSIAWKTAVQAHAEGARFVLTNAPIAMRMGKINELAEATGSEIIPADATSVEDIENLVSKAMETADAAQALKHPLGRFPKDPALNAPQQSLGVPAST